MTDEPGKEPGTGPLRSNLRQNTELKLQLSNAYPADFDQLAQVLHAVCTDGRGRIPMEVLADRMGLAVQQVKNLGSLAQAFNLIERITYQPSPVGSVIHEFDPFFDDLGTLWYAHFSVSTDPRHVVWNRLVTTILPARRTCTRDQARADLNDLRQWYSEDSIKKHVLKEVNTVLDAYTEQRLSRLAYLRRSGDSYALGYREPVPPLVLLASVARYRDVHHPGATAIPIPELAVAPNGPGVIFQLSEERLRALLESHRTQPGVAVESRADLDQVRLGAEATPAYWLRRHYESRPGAEPRGAAPGGTERHGD